MESEQTDPPELEPTQWRKIRPGMGDNINGAIIACFGLSQKKNRKKIKEHVISEAGKVTYMYAFFCHQLNSSKAACYYGVTIVLRTVTWHHLPFELVVVIITWTSEKPSQKNEPDITVTRVPDWFKWV